MTPEPTAPDQPFPGARSQVPGVQYEPTDSAPQVTGGPAQPASSERATERTLLLESSPTSLERGWSVRLPVRAEQVTVGKQVVVYERVQVSRREFADQQRVAATVRREELRVDVDRHADTLPARPTVGDGD